MAAAWERAWDRFAPFLRFPPMPRRVVCTTNGIESVNHRLGKVGRSRGRFPDGRAVVRLLWLAICDIGDRRAGQREKADRGRRHEGGCRLIEGRGRRQLETDPRPTRRRIPRTHGTIPLKKTTKNIHTQTI